MKVCIIGFGGIARSHTASYFATMQEGKEQTLVGICDIDPKQFDRIVSINNSSDNGIDLDQIHKYTDWEEMLDTEKPDLVDICLPTYLHKEYAINAMKKGYHVQCEKPMALTSEECKEMLQVAKETGRQLLIGQVVRFTPAYQELKNMVVDGRYGKVRSAVFNRLSVLPLWGFENWFPDVKRSGGVPLDLHLHDVDIIRYIFGDPEGVSASVVSAPECERISVHSLFHYPNMAITAIGEFARAKTAPFVASYDVNFEKATVVCVGSKVTIYPDEGEVTEHSYADITPMRQEELYYAGVLNGKPNTVLLPEDAARSVELVEKIVESAANGGRKVLL